MSSLLQILNRIMVLAQNTLREAVRNRLLYNLLFFAVLMIVSSILLAELHLGHSDRIYRDVGLSAIAGFGSLIAIFVGIGLLSREIDQKTVYIVLSKPIGRWEFLAGKFVGLAGVLMVQVVAMGACFLGVLWLQGAEITGGLFQAIGLIYTELVLLTALALFFSTFTTSYLAGMFTLAFWVVGHLLMDLRTFGAHSEVESLRLLTESLYWTLPNLDRLDLKAEAAAGLTSQGVHVVTALAYAACYSLGLLLAAASLFRRRDFH
ncbi:ABC transporter permease [Myxococcota bacterium]|nr:ABC transporter permease [Myxococcota bacterium]